MLNDIFEVMTFPSGFLPWALLMAVDDSFPGALIISARMAQLWDVPGFRPL